jgi:hypothetical protein
MAVPMVITVGLEEALNGGEGDDRDELGFRCGGGIGQRRRRRRLGFVQNFYTAPGRVPRHTVEEGGGASERGRWARRRAVVLRDEGMRMSSFFYFVAEGVRGLALGCGCWTGPGFWWAVLVDLAEQVRSR